MRDAAVFAAFVAVASGAALWLAHIAIWAPRRVRVKAGALGLAVVLFAAFAGAHVEALGRPKPIAWEWHQLPARTPVLAFKLEEPRAIYVWLDLGEPRAYALPWSKEVAQALVQARRQGEADGTGIEMQTGAGPRSDQPTFHARPQPANPPKATR